MPSSPTRPSRWRSLARDRVVLGATTAAVALAGLQLVGTGTAVAATDGGRPQVVVPLTPSTPTSGTTLNSGGSATAFELKLVDAAACTGDSAAGGYRVQTYLVSGSIDPQTLTFDANGPTAASTGTTVRQPLFDVDATPQVNLQTANADTTGGPGRIVSLPAFALDVAGEYGIDEYPAGTYNVGIACTKGTAGPTQLDKVFNTTIQIVAAAGDANGFTFTVPTNGAPTGGGTGSTTSTTAAGGSTTSTTRAGSSTTSTTASGASTTSTTAAVGGDPTTSAVPGAGAGRLPTTGSSTLELVIWALLLLTVGRIFFLLRRGAQVVAGSGAHGLR